jgi:hypothetical protein
MAKIAKTSKTFRLRTSLVQDLARLAIRDNRTDNNMVETLLLWAVKQPDILERIRSSAN